MKLTQKLLALTFLSSAAFAQAAPLPNTIVIEDKAVVPIIKTEIIRTIKGQPPERQVQATVHEITNNGKDIVSRDIAFNDQQAEFSNRGLSTPVIQKGSVIVPTSKIEVNSRVKQGGEVLAEATSVDAQGVEFKKGQAPAQRNLQIDRIQNPNTAEAATRAVVKKDGVKTRDIVVVEGAPQ